VSTEAEHDESWALSPGTRCDFPASIRAVIDFIVGIRLPGCPDRNEIIVVNNRFDRTSGERRTATTISEHEGPGCHGGIHQSASEDFLDIAFNRSAQLHDPLRQWLQGGIREGFA
jgi:hypothetical protein